MKINSTTVSVILPVFNAEKYIDIAINSILKQTYSDFELLLLNDGSTDNSLELMKIHANIDSRCQIHSWPNQGLIKTLNTGIELAKGNILLRMDADDICHPQRFERQIKHLQSNPKCVAVGTQVMLIDPEGEPLINFISPQLHADIDRMNLSNTNGSAIVHPTAAMRKEAVIAVGGYHSEYLHAEDIDLFLRLAEVGELNNLDEILLDYRQHLASIGYQHSQKQMESVKLAVMAAEKRRGNNLAIIKNNTFHTRTGTNSSDIYRKWAWWALRGGNLNVARKHSWNAIKNAPMNRHNIKLTACLIRDQIRQLF